MNTEWPKVSLGELLRLERRPVKVRPDEQYQEIGIYCFGRGIFHKTPRTGFEVGDKDLFLLKEGDFILQVTFAWEGAVAIVSRAEDGMYGSTRYPSFRVNESRCISQFLLLYFKTAKGLQQLVNICPGSAGRNRVLSIKRIPEILVPLPPLSEQRKIVARIEEMAAKVDDARALRQQAANEGEVLLVAGARRVFKSSMASNWGRVSLEDCCEAIIDYRGRTPPTAEEGIPHLTSANIKNGNIHWKTSKYVTQETYTSYMTRGIPKPGDVIFTMEAPLGEAAVIPDDRRFSLAQRTLLLRPNRTLVEPQFFARVLTSPDVREAIYAQATGTTVKGIASKRLKHISLPIPPISRQSEIVAYLDKLQAQIEAMLELQSETTDQLDSLMPSILDKAFRGEL